MRHDENSFAESWAAVNPCNETEMEALSLKPNCTIRIIFLNIFILF